MPNTDEQNRKERARARVAEYLDNEQSQRRENKTTSRHPEQGNRRKKPTDSPKQKLTVGSVFIGLLESYGLKFIAVLAIIAVLVVSFFAGTVLRSCANESKHNSTDTSSIPSSSATASTSSTDGSADNSSSNEADSSDEPSLHKIALLVAEKKEQLVEEEDAVQISDILEENLVKKIEAQAKVNKDSAWIAKHPSEYAYDGWAVQYKILKLAAEEPAATTYVREWPELYPAEDQNLKSPHAIQGTTTGPKNIPQLYQWDPRWGYTVYSSTAFGMTGCCPTTLAMVYQGLTGKTDMTPYDMGVLAANDGYMSEYEGTDAFFLINEAQGLGLNCYEIYLATESMLAALENGDVLIANVGPGDFTNDGHFIVVTGLKDGKLIVNDPYSKQRSEKLWDPDEVMNQCKAVFAYSKA